jgi:hypothetical protein
MLLFLLLLLSLVVSVVFASMWLLTAWCVIALVLLIVLVKLFKPRPPIYDPYRINRRILMRQIRQSQEERS